VNRDTHDTLLDIQVTFFDPNIVSIYRSFLIVIFKKVEGNLVDSQQLFELFSPVWLSTT